MVNTEKTLSIHDYLEIARRRKWHIILPLVISILISFAVYKILPRVYKATTLILVQAQTVPENYVRSTITSTVIDRLNTISQEILSRTRLERIIQEFNLYPELRRKQPMEVVVEKMSKAIKVNVAKGLETENRSENRSDKDQNAFFISFEGEEPRTVMMVTNKLASLFIEENLRVREIQAEGTSEFLSKELSRIEEALAKKEQGLRNFRERNMGQLPQQLDANIKIMEGLQQQLQRVGDGIRAAEDKATVIQGQIEILTRSQRSAVSSGPDKELIFNGDTLEGGQGPEDLIVAQYNQLKRDLISAQAKYTDSHPDVVDLKGKIAKLEPKAKEIIARQEAAAEVRRKEMKARQEKALSGKDAIVIADPATERLVAQYRAQHTSAILEAKRMRDEERKLKDQVSVYQKRIEDSPKREQEMLFLTRDYDLLKANYQSLLDKKIQAQMAESLERKQQGEQFKILDPARLPEKPIKPDRNRILLMGAIFGLMSGLGLAWFRESMDQSFYSVADVEDYLKLTVLAEIPSLKPEQRGIAHRA
jgi:polysaccharide chain length determinant protein (PEP-CTERM system associated)